jgi:uncharacterized protein (TIGR00369 family)
MDDSRAEAVAQEAYARWLGVTLERAGEGAARIELPYREENSNPGKQVHGGVVASALAIAARAAALTGTELAEPCATGTLYLSVAYLASAVGEAIHAEGRVMRRGKELCYVSSEATNPQGKPLGTATVVYRAAPGVDPAPMPIAADRSGDAVAGLAPIGQALTGAPFISGVGIVAEQMRDGLARLRLPYRETNLGAAGAIHEGAIAALHDTCGSLAAWSLVKPQRGMRVSTVGIDVNFVNPVIRHDLIARSRTLGRKREVFFNRVEIESADGAIAAYGSVIYRIVLPEQGSA